MSIAFFYDCSQTLPNVQWIWVLGNTCENNATLPHQLINWYLLLVGATKMWPTLDPNLGIGFLSLKPYSSNRSTVLDTCGYWNVTEIWSESGNWLLISATLPNQLFNCFGCSWILKCDQHLVPINCLSAQPYPTDCSTSDKTFPSSSLLPTPPTTCSLSLFPHTQRWTCLFT